MSTEVKGFRDLVAEVQDKGICGKCGGCVAFCSAGEFNALSAGDDGTPVMVDESRCLHCGICYLICPQIKTLDQELRQKTGWKAPIGPQRELVSARARSRKIRKRGHRRRRRDRAPGLRPEEAPDPGGDRLAAGRAVLPRTDGGDEPRGADRGRRDRTSTSPRPSARSANGTRPSPRACAR